MKEERNEDNSFVMVEVAYPDYNPYIEEFPKDFTGKVLQRVHQKSIKTELANEDFIIHKENEEVEKVRYF